MSAGQPPRPGFPGAIRAGVRPGAPPQQPGARPPMMAGPRPGVAGIPPQGAVRPGMVPRTPVQEVLQQVRPGLVPRSPMQPRVPSPVRSVSPAGARPAVPGVPTMARPGVPGQVMPQRLPVGAQVPGAAMPMRPAAGASPQLLRPTTGAPAALVRPAAGAPLVRPAAGAPLVRPAAGAPLVRPAAGVPLVRPAAGAPLVRPAAGAPLVRPAAGAPLVRPAAGVAVPGVRPVAGVAAPGVRPAAGVAFPGVRPAAGAPFVRPAAGAPVPSVRPAAGVPVPQVRPAAGVAAPAARPAAATPVMRPAVGGPATVLRPAVGAPGPAVRPAGAPGAPVMRPAAAAAPPTARLAAPAAAPARPAAPAPVQVPAAPAAAPPAQPLPTAGGDRVSTCDLNMDDIKETFRQVFQGQPPEPSQRAEPGTEGKPCKVTVNMYPVTLPQGHVYHYDIEIFSAAKKAPEGPAPVPAQKRARCASTLVNREVIDAFSKCYRSELGNCLLAFDGRKNLYTRRMLPFTDHIFNNVEAEVNGEKCAFVVRIAYAATVSFDALHAMYDSPVKGTNQFQDAVQVADVILRTGPTLAFVPVGRSFFMEAGKPINLTGNREVWFGFYSSIRLGSWKPLVNIDMSATAFYSAVPLLDFAVTVLKKRGRDDLKAGMNDRDRVLLAREIRTLKVVVTHLDSRRQYRIEGLRQKPANQETFDLQGTQTTVTQYFMSKYNKSLLFPNLPCIYTGRGNTFLPMEVCTLVKGQHCRKKLNEIQTATMIKQTALTPKDRFEKIRQSTGHLKQTSAQICKEFDMTLDTNPIEIEARILKPPVITLGDKKRQIPKDGVWKCDSFLKPANIEKWVLAVLGRVGAAKPKLVVDLFQQEGGKLGMKIAPPKLVHTYGHQAKPRQVLEDVKNKHPDVEMTVVILDPRSDYGALKAEAETSDLCMRTQCVKDINIEKKFNSMFAVNLLQKMNTKMGGRNNGVFLANTPKTLKRPYMAIGVDVNHPGPGDTTPSIAAFVASMDAIPSQYYACTSVQLNRKGSRSEYVVETKSMFLECLTEFQKRNKDLPAHIFIFRDGVADAQFDAVRIYELGAIRKACLEIRADYTPGMTFIVVQKRHHVRFMPADGDKGYGRTGNIHAGTIVDSKIINPAIFDFYLCSHQGIQGTSRAAHYHVVHDDVHHTQDEIYKICYNLCHTYARCPRAVSIPAPAYYAHLAAFRAKEHIKGRAQHNGPYAESNSGSVRSSSSSEPDLDKFQSAQKVLNQMRGSMYFV